AHRGLGRGTPLSGCGGPPIRSTFVSVAQPLAFRADRVVAAVMAETEDASLLYARVLQAMAEALSCRFGAVWEIDQDGEAISCVEAWCSPGLAGAEFVRLMRESHFEPGVGLPGRVWTSRQPAWFGGRVLVTNILCAC